MNPEVKTKWLAALRSGDYKQGRNVLGRVDADSGEEFCCLGVLCELAEKEGVVKPWLHVRPDRRHHRG